MGHSTLPPTPDGNSVTDVQFKAASSEEAQTGLLGWVSCTVNRSLRLDGITLRRTHGGRHALSFPARRDASGRQYFFVRPLGDAARKDFEHQIFVTLGLDVGATR